MNKNVGLIVAIALIISLIGLALYGNLTGTKHHKAIIEMEDGNKIVIELYQEVAPKTVNNFIKLANSKFYDGLKFHRIIKDFMIQGGDPNGDGTGGSNKTVFGEFASNGFKNNLSHLKGTVSLARGEDFNSGSSQFFITVADRTELDGNYAAFGRVIEGMEAVETYAALETDTINGVEDMPVNPPVIKTIRIEKYSIDYDNTIYTEKTSTNTSDSSEAFSMEDLYYSMYEAQGYTKNEDGTLTSPEGKTYTLEDLINESYYEILEESGYKRNEDGTVTSPEGKTLSLNEAIQELESSTATDTVEATTDAATDNTDSATIE